jgi:carbamoyltransferase
MRERLNRDIKYREQFRPFAPVTPIESADRYFELPPGGARLARFMSGVFPVRPEWRTKLAAITHVDGSARLQTLERDMAPRLHALLEAYGRRTGIPVLLNTSFNVAGEPIVNRALEGYSTFRRCGIDALVAGPTVVTKRAPSPSKEAGKREALKEDVA